MNTLAQNLEIWLEVPQYKTKSGSPAYEVSSEGRVRRILYYGDTKKMTKVGGVTPTVLTRQERGLEDITMPVYPRMDRSEPYVVIWDYPERKRVSLESLVQSIFPN